MIEITVDSERKRKPLRRNGSIAAIARANLRHHAAQRTGDIYVLICKPTAQAYVGQSVASKHRLKQHRAALRKGCHSSVCLQSAWQRYGESAFLFTVVERGVDENFLHAREQFWMWRFGERLLNASETAHPDMSYRLSLLAMKKVSDRDLIEECVRRGIWK